MLSFFKEKKSSKLLLFRHLIKVYFDTGAKNSLSKNKIQVWSATMKFFSDNLIWNRHNRNKIGNVNYRVVRKWQNWVLLDENNVKLIKTRSRHLISFSISCWFRGKIIYFQTSLNKTVILNLFCCRQQSKIR